jgi:MoaA/NifB/PqqE/SkfB family radical SAM enzyme
MCIKEAYKDWYRRDMDIDNFKKITPYLHNVENVVLEGWGESLLHENLTEFIRLVKPEGPEVGFVTSGTDLNEDYAVDLVSAGIDFVGFSLSGATGKTHNAIRVNSDFDTLISSIRLFKKLSIEGKNKKKPKIHIVYLTLADNIHEVPLLIELAKEIGVEEVVLINITHVTTTWQDSQKTFTCGDKEPYKTIMREAEMRARQSNIKLTRPSLSSSEVAVCSENPLKNLYISVDGEVSPCVYLYPPIPSPFKRIFCGEKLTVEKISFGNIFRESFETIWNRKEYIEFRSCFIQRQKKLDEIYNSLLELKHFEDSFLPNPPQHCKTCYKMLGL